MSEPGDRPLPRGFTALGYAGLLPFAGCVLGIALPEGEARAFAVRALAACALLTLGLLAVG